MKKHCVFITYVRFMLNKFMKVQVCDATGAGQSDKARYIKCLLFMKFILLLLFFFTSFTLCAQESVPYDSSAVEARLFNITAIDSFKAQRDFRYQDEIAESPSLWDRFWQWFWEKYDEIMSTESGRTTMKIVYIVLGLVAVAFFVYRVMRMNRLALFASEVAYKTPYSLEEEDIHAINFDMAIREAEEEGNYRLAIRLLYLQNLKRLADKNMILWLPGKTNSDYKKELKETAFGESFHKLTTAFESAWYGDKAITKPEYEALNGDFSFFKSQLN